jgi:hypothetical protein
MAAMVGVMATGLGLSNSEWAAVVLCEVCLEWVAVVVLNLDDFEWATVRLHMLCEVEAKVLAEAKRPILSASGWEVD